jgi:hypothetical protein
MVLLLARNRLVARATLHFRQTLQFVAFQSLSKVKYIVSVALLDLVPDLLALDRLPASLDQ